MITEITTSHWLLSRFVHPAIGAALQQLGIAAPNDIRADPKACASAAPSEAAYLVVWSSRVRMPVCELGSFACPHRIWSNPALGLQGVERCA